MNYRLATVEDSHALAEIANACAPELQDNFTMQLGITFQQAYYAVLLNEPSTVAVCAEKEKSNRMVGFAFGTLDSQAMMESLSRSRRKLAFATFGGLVRRPWLLAGLLRRAGALVRKQGVERYVVTQGAKVSFLAVDPRERTSHAGPKLMKYIIASLRTAGARAIQAEVDQSNPRVIRMHCRLGAEIVRNIITPSGVHRVVIEYPDVSIQDVA